MTTMHCAHLPRREPGLGARAANEANTRFTTTSTTKSSKIHHQEIENKRRQVSCCPFNKKSC